MKSHNCSVFLNLYVVLIYVVTWRSKEQSTKKIKCFDFIFYIYIYIIFLPYPFSFRPSTIIYIFFLQSFHFSDIFTNHKWWTTKYFFALSGSFFFFFLIILTFSIFALFYPSTKWTVTNSIEVYRFTYAGL